MERKKKGKQGRRERICEKKIADEILWTGAGGPSVDPTGGLSL